MASLALANCVALGLDPLGSYRRRGDEVAQLEAANFYNEAGMYRGGLRPRNVPERPEEDRSFQGTSPKNSPKTSSTLGRKSFRETSKNDTTPEDSPKPSPTLGRKSSLRETSKNDTTPEDSQGTSSTPEEKTTPFQRGGSGRGSWLKRLGFGKKNDTPKTETSSTSLTSPLARRLKQPGKRLTPTDIKHSQPTGDYVHAPVRTDGTKRPVATVDVNETFQNLKRRLTFEMGLLAEAERQLYELEKDMPTYLTREAIFKKLADTAPNAEEKQRWSDEHQQAESLLDAKRDEYKNLTADAGRHKAEIKKLNQLLNKFWG